MKKRNPIAVFILSLITLGIYDIYWLVKTKQELNQKTKIHIPTIWLLFLPVFIFIAAIITLIAGSNHTHTVSSYTTSSNSTTFVTTSHSSMPAIAIILYVVAVALTFLISFYWFFKFAKAVNEYTRGKMSTGVAFLLLWILHFLGVAIVQDSFNDMSGDSQVPVSSPAEPAPQMTVPQESIGQGFTAPGTSTSAETPVTPPVPAEEAATSEATSKDDRQSVAETEPTVDPVSENITPVIPDVTDPVENSAIPSEPTVEPVTTEEQVAVTPSDEEQPTEETAMEPIPDASTSEEISVPISFSSDETPAEEAATSEAAQSTESEASSESQPTENLNVPSETESDSEDPSNVSL